MSDLDANADNPITINPNLAKLIKDKLGQNVSLCYQCVKCTSGCPVAEFFDWQPNQIMRAVQLGQEDIALESETPWLCASCQACTTRCPQNLDIAAIMDFLTREAVSRGIKPPIPVINIFNEAFMREVRIWGRSFELGTMAEIKIRTRDFTSDLDLGMRMLRKQKLSFVPSIGRPPKKTKQIPDASTAIAYYPGCSLHSSATEFDLSSRAVSKALGLELIEPDGWICCGSSAAHKIDPAESLRLPLVNLALIEQSGFKEVTMPCAACFNRHKVAQHEIHDNEDTKQKTQELIGYQFQDNVQVNTLIETIYHHVGVESIAEEVKWPLKDLKVVCYYGCLLTRPSEVTGSAHPENPTEMDELIEAIGTEVIDWSYKTSCCGAAHSLTRTDIVHKLSGNLIQKAREAGADAIAVACPLCHLNLDGRQFQIEPEAPMPVLYFTQLMALALSLTKKAASLDKNLVDPRPLLREKGLLE
jgi:heterodisulfide reductase subunit B